MALVVSLAVTAALAALELIAIALPPPNPSAAIVERRAGGPWIRSDRQFGYGAAEPDGAYRATKRMAGGALAYDVTYTFENGIRATRGNPAGPCTVLFMIDSVAFGEGLDDDATLPAQYSAATEFKLNVVNLAFPGYGPHQMLRRIEDGWADRHVRARPAAVFYTVNDNHIWRSVGVTGWNRFDPRLVLGDDGVVRRNGRFHGLPGWPSSWAQFRREVLGFLRGSTFFTNVYGFPEWNRADDIRHAKRMFVAMVAQTHRALRERWNVPLTVLIFVENPWVETMYMELEHVGVNVLRYRDFTGPLLPNVHIIPGDGHPTRLTNQIVARGLAQRIRGCG